MNIIDYFDRGHDLNPRAVCFVSGDTGDEYTYSQIRELSLKIANGLLQEGFKKEDRAAVLSINHPISFTCTLGVLRSGMAWVPIHPGNALQENIQVMQLADVEILFYLSIFEKYIKSLLDNVQSIKKVICIDKAGENAQALEDWVKAFPAAEIDRPYEPNALAVIQPTGGTTGKPKGARHTQMSISAGILSNLCVTYYDDKPPIYIAAAPLTHAGGYVCLSILSRGGKVIVESKLDIKRFLSLIPKYKVTTVFLPPTVIYGLLGYSTIRDYDFSSLKYFLYGAAPMAPSKLKEACNIFGNVMMQMFGQTECIFPITYLSPQDHARAIEKSNDKIFSSCGKQTPTARLAIMDGKGNLMPDGETGEIVVRTSMTMQGYHKNQKLSEETLSGGWLHTGDVGYRDTEGYFYIVDRKKDMIITGGFNVFSVEVEKAVMAHPAIEECVVIGVPDEKWGEAVKAVVKLKSGSVATGEEIIAKCKELVGSIKAPKSVDFVDSIPRNQVGKVLKRKVRDEYWKESNRKVG